jgi:thiamine biosynthesis lipoprotein
VKGSEVERRAALFGSRVRILIGPPTDARVKPAELAALEAEAAMRVIHAHLTRFDPDSELSRLNRSPRATVDASGTMLAFFAAALRASRATGGLVVPTVLDGLEQAGYRSSLQGRIPASLAEALRAAPPRTPAVPDACHRWSALAVDPEAMTVTRPPGTRLDSGGIAKGLAADMFAGRLAAYECFAVDCGGDLRIGGAGSTARIVEVTHPLTGQVVHRLGVRCGGVATSGLDRRIWRSPEGEYRHHLIDPGRGLPAWTGIIQATALAPTALEAEWRAKAALLSGPEVAPRVLSSHGGVLIGDDGRVETISAAGSPETATSAAA